MSLHVFVSVNHFFGKEACDRRKRAKEIKQGNYILADVRYDSMSYISTELCNVFMSSDEFGGIY